MKCGSNEFKKKNPTELQFEAAYKSIIVHVEIKSPSKANYMVLDDSSILRVSSKVTKGNYSESELLNLLCSTEKGDETNDDVITLYQHGKIH